MHKHPSEKWKIVITFVVHKNWFHMSSANESYGRLMAGYIVNRLILTDQKYFLVLHYNKQRMHG